MKWLWVVLACACSKPLAPTRYGSNAMPAGSSAAAPVAATPVAAAPAKLVARGSLAAGNHHVCALRANGRVACWGQGGPALGQPGASDQLVPTDVPVIEDAVGIAAGRDVTCAWTRTGEVWCWGGEESNRQADHAPRRVPQLHDVVQVVVSFDGACGLRATGRVACWKIDTWQDPLYPGPAEVAGIADAVEIAGDDDHLCARTRRGDVLCTAGADLRHPDIQTEHIVAIAEAAGATSLAGDHEHFAALLPGDKLAAWDMAAVERASPSPDPEVVIVPLPAVARGAERLYSGAAVNDETAICAAGDGRGACWKFHEILDGSLAGERVLEPGVQDVAIGGDASCVRVADRARCWGMIGRRGDGLPELPTAPVAVVGISDARQLEAGLDQMCVLRASGRVACWGARAGYADGGPVMDRAPVELPGVDDAVEIAMSSDVVCARRKRGATCWTTELEGGAFHAVDAPELASAVRLFSGEEICGADAHGAVACTHFEPPALHPPHGAEELQKALAAHQPLCVTTFDNGIDCVHGAGNITLEHTDNYDQWCQVIGGQIMCHSETANPGVLDGFESLHDVVSWDGRYAVRADGSVASRPVLAWATEPADPPVAKFHDVVELRQTTRALCARLRNGAVACWGPRDDLGAGQQTSPAAHVEVSGLVMGATPAVVPSAPIAVAPPAPPKGPVKVLHPAVMSGPFANERAACAAQRCKAGEQLDCRVDDDDDDVPGSQMPSPPAPFTKARLVSMDCRDPSYRRDGVQTFRLLVERAGKVWVSRALFSAGGNDHYCDMVVLPSWTTHDLVAGGAPELVATVFARTSCRGANGGDDSDDRFLIAAGNGGRPYYFSPLAVAAGAANSCPGDDRPCTPTEDAAQLTTSFPAAGGLTLTGDPAAAKSHKLAAIGTYRFATR